MIRRLGTVLRQRWLWSSLGLIVALCALMGRALAGDAEVGDTQVADTEVAEVPDVEVVASPEDGADELAEDGRAAITFAGFHVFEDGTSRIWVKLDRKVKVDRAAPKPTRLIYTLHDSRVLVKNNKNPLITSHFASPVISARLVSKKPDTELVVVLRQPLMPTHRLVERPDGTVSLQIDFPALPPPGAEPPKSKSQ